MIERLAGKLRGQRKSIVLMISERNLRGQLFFRSMGFRSTCTVRQPFWYADHDGYLMVFRVKRPLAASHNS